MILECNFLFCSFWLITLAGFIFPLGSFFATLPSLIYPPCKPLSFSSGPLGFLQISLILLPIFSCNYLLSNSQRERQYVQDNNGTNGKSIIYCQSWRSGMVQLMVLLNFISFGYAAQVSMKRCYIRISQYLN